MKLTESQIDILVRAVIIHAAIIELRERGILR